MCCLVKGAISFDSLQSGSVCRGPKLVCANERLKTGSREEKSLGLEAVQSRVQGDTVSLILLLLLSLSLALSLSLSLSLSFSLSPFNHTRPYMWALIYAIPAIVAMSHVTPYFPH